LKIKPTTLLTVVLVALARIIHEEVN